MAQGEFLISEEIKRRIKASDKRFFANDCISEFFEEGEKEMLIDELTCRFEGVLDTLIIDRENDPNSQGTGKTSCKNVCKRNYVW